MKTKRNLVLGVSPNGHGVSFTPKNNMGSNPITPTNKPANVRDPACALSAKVLIRNVVGVTQTNAIT